MLSEEMEHLVEQEFISYPFEWLVKWKGLGYEYATWELETASFLSSPEAMTLKSDFEGRIKKAKEYSHCQRAEKVCLSCLVIDFAGIFSLSLSLFTTFETHLFVPF